MDCIAYGVIPFKRSTGFVDAAREKANRRPKDCFNNFFFPSALKIRRCPMWSNESAAHIS
jgi:hypothetical protein